MGRCASRAPLHWSIATKLENGDLTMLAHIFDLLVMLTLILFPIFLVIKFNLKGIFAGTLFVWFLLIISGIVLNYLDPSREGAINDFFSLTTGWLFGLMYCGAIYLIKFLMIKFRKYKTNH
jgi:hypothetical protein